MKFMIDQSKDFIPLVQQERFRVARLHIIQDNFLQNRCFPVAQFHCFPCTLSKCVFILLNCNKSCNRRVYVLLVIKACTVELYRTREGWYIVCFLQMFNCIHNYICPILGSLSNYIKGHSKSNVHIIYCGIWVRRTKTCMLCIGRSHQALKEVVEHLQMPIGKYREDNQ